ncbi:hypothetical protein VCHA54P496_180052 [Vibrio chagasii]|nr:hypothetical protein VCHA54P495_180052 [Vibrio chagasii]CAH7027079.1 hypothetical protein VCHA54P496_180052 [Vibrio chagasii]CAH7306866.1 hypothetical protein VCHA54P486_200026 [Vibrio chagasii]
MALIAQLADVTQLAIITQLTIVTQRKKFSEQMFSIQHPLTYNLERN